MSTERAPGTAPRRFSLAGLSANQIELLCTVLKAGDVPHAVSEGDLVTGGAYSADVEKALLWVRVEGDDEFDDPEYRSDRPPVVKPSRPPLADGRRMATRWRRVSGGVIDLGLLVIPAYIAWRNDMPGPLVVAALFLATVPSVAVGGWSLGKLLVGTRVVSATTLRTPNVLSATARWIVASAPLLTVMIGDLSGDSLTPLLMVVYGPVVLALRGLHDYGAGTLVVERTTRGPSRW
jgi:hypothetical protein